MVSLITGIYGGYDTLAGLPSGHGFDRAVCVTDDPSITAEGWEVLHVPSEDGYRLAAKRPKLTPFDFVDDELVVWVDGSVVIRDINFRQFCVDALEGFELLAFDHPDDRDCLFQEAAYCQDWPQNRHMLLRQQTKHYRAEGMPEHFGLWACAVLGWRQTGRAVEFGRAWLDENRRWSTRDQVSLPFLLWSMPLDFGVWPAHEQHNDFLTIRPHNLRR
jgi:hypothetical protein